ncbi:endonuclease domain-containing protein [Azospirillum sp. SYSU D00513]|uniref:endonuclease domain-containing protein n=1 Tax=Azospirillum sp. SYSU D00513 TaxID=2812561 RepID=UPI001FFE79AE|nr:endonuclease domain-containing protein [Azospirillum sp. SYSU D00513]
MLPARSAEVALSPGGEGGAQRRVRGFTGDGELSQRGSPSPQPSPRGGEGAVLRSAKDKPTPSETARARNLRLNATDVEKLLWQKLRNAQLGAKFRRQEPILGFTVDFVAHDHRLIIELDGGQHADRVEHDQRRTRMLEQVGFRILRFWNNEVNENLEGVLQTIASTLSATAVVRRPAAAFAPSPGSQRSEASPAANSANGVCASGASRHPLPGRERDDGDDHK